MYNSLNNAMKKRFGTKIYKLALSGGMTCPTRDGTLGTRGCIFCSSDGSGHFAEHTCKDIDEQIERAKLKVKNKIKDGKYIAYFQDHTNTYADVDYLRTIFTKAINNPDIAVLSIATRPDCLPSEVIDLLKELNKVKPVWVELGLQTIHEKTAEYIRRGYPLTVFDEAMKKLKEANIETIVHIILGLPGEGKKMMLETVKYAADRGINGIKLQLLHVIKGTDLETDYNNGLFRCLELPEYIDILEDCIRILPPQVVIHRLTGDGAKCELVAPLWSADKKRVLNAINSAFTRDHVIQGEGLQ